MRSYASEILPPFIEIARKPQDPAYSPVINADALLDLRRQMGLTPSEQTQTTKFYFGDVLSNFNPAKVVGRTFTTHPDHIRHSVPYQNISDQAMNIHVILGEIVKHSLHDRGKLVHEYVKDSVHAAASGTGVLAAGGMTLVSGVDLLVTGDSLQILIDSGAGLIGVTSLFAHFKLQANKKYRDLYGLAVANAKHFPIVTIKKVV